ncbi:MAG: hypothetical protein KAS39_04055 [Actinomycetia bacterium]|nr:hypothetical protein [Actinomycetes bacterium]
MIFNNPFKDSLSEKKYFNPMKRAGKLLLKQVIILSIFGLGFVTAIILLTKYLAKQISIL